MNQVTGSSFLEILLTLSLIIILTGIIVPNYHCLVRESNRRQAEVELFNILLKIEQSAKPYFTDQTNKFNTEKFSYQFQIKKKGEKYLIHAIPIGLQAKDSCGELTLSSIGIKKASHKDCW